MHKLKNLIIFSTVLFACIFFFKVSPVRAASPALLFSDIVKGPATGLTDATATNQGAIVTVWGVGLGSSQGSSKIYVGSVEVPSINIYYWKNADGTKPGGPADLYTRQKMQEIAFAVPSTAPTGSQPIKVTVGGVDSNALAFEVATSGNFIFVKSFGTDNGTCGTWTSPCLTLQYAINNRLAAGDFIYVASDLTIANTVTHDSPGTATNSKSIIAYPNTAVILQGGIGYQLAHYSVVAKFISQKGCSMGEASRFIGMDITVLPYQQTGAGILGGTTKQGGPDGVPGRQVIYGNYFHDTDPHGSNQEHVTYFTHRNWDTKPIPMHAPDIGWNRFYNNSSRFAIHFYDEGHCGKITGTTLIHDNWIELQQSYGIGFQGGCLSGYSFDVDTVYIYNNVLVDTGASLPSGVGGLGVAIQLGNSADLYGTFYFYNNTIYGYSRNQTLYQSAIRQNGAPNITWYWRNNLVVDTNNQPFYSTYSTYVDPLTHTNNLWYSTSGNKAAPGWDTSPIINTDPLLTNSSSYNFSLQSGSSAKDAGFNVSSVVTKDFLGVTRPQGSAFDIGAFEYASAGTSDTNPPAAPTGVTVQ